MGDASCSGSTPFKQLIDHQRRDGGMNQDRMVGPGASGAQGSFRSAPHPAQAQSQQDFAAFMDGANIPQMHPHDPAGRLAAHAAALDPINAPRGSPGMPMGAFQQAWQPPAPAMDNWAADFQRMSQQRAPSGPTSAPAMAASSAYTTAPSTMQTNFQAGFGQAFGQNMGYAPLYGPTNGGFTNFAMAQAQRPAAEADFQDEMNKWMAVHGPKGNMDEVDAVMDQMARELELNESALAEPEQSSSNAEQQHAAPAETLASKETTQTDTSQNLTQEENLASSSHFTDLETPEISNLSIDATQLREALNQEATSQEAANKSRSAVAEAAEQLLDTVQHETGEKWQNSKFLNLMRDFRDGKKDIVNDRIEEVRASPARSESGRIPSDFRKTHSYASTPSRTPTEGSSPRRLSFEGGTRPLMGNHDRE